MDITVSPAAGPGQDEEDFNPDLPVSAGTIGEACEVLALVAAAARAEPAIMPALARFLARQGADPACAMDWLVTRAATLAADLHWALEQAGISIDPVLDQYRGGDW